jgi:hypothetical protein
MNARIKLALPLMLATSAALAATGYVSTTANDDMALRSSEAHPYVEPGTRAEDVAAPVTTESTAVPIAEPAIVPAPEVTTYRERSAVTVTAPRPSDDELLRNAVMDRLATDGRLAGRIGVESYRHVVSLTGRVTTTGQIERAETIARSVDGVRDVDNRLTARVGMI